MKASFSAALLVSLAAGCSVPQPLPQSNAAGSAHAPFVDARPIPERTSVVELEAYRTLVSFAEDVLRPDATTIFGEALLAAKIDERAKARLSSFRVQVSLPPSKTTFEVYKAMHLPDGPPDPNELMRAISKSMQQGPTGAALVVCEVEADINGRAVRALIRESYKADLSYSKLVMHMREAAAEAVAEAKAAR